MSGPGAVPGILTLARANIGRHRGRSLLVAIIIGLSALLLVTALGSLMGFKQPIEQMLENQNASHALINFDNRVYDPQALRSWWLQHPAVESVTPIIHTAPIAGRARFENREVGFNLMLSERPAKPMSQDLLRIVQGQETATHPGPGEIWLTTTAAATAGVVAGDQIDIPAARGSRSYRVSAVVVDPQYSSGFSDSTRAWVAPGELIYFTSLSGLSQVSMGVRLHDVDLLKSSWREFNQYLGGGFTGSYLSYPEMINSYSFMVQMLSVMMLVFAVLALLVALFIVSSTISGEVLANYRTFGILKSVGYTPANLIGIFVVQFGLLAIVAVPVGLMLGWLVIGQLLALMMQSVGLTDFEQSVLVPALISAAMVLVTVALVAGLGGLRAARVKPASSIRYGAPERTANRRSPVAIQWARVMPVSLVLGIKSLLGGKRRDLYDLITVTLAGFTMVFSANLYYSMAENTSNRPFWGLDGADILLQRDGGRLFGIPYEKLQSVLGERSDVVAIIGKDSEQMVLPATAERDARFISGDVLDGDYTKVQYQLLRGTHPVASGEVSIGVSMAEELALEPGDSVDMVLRGQPVTLTVTGVFQGTSNSGFWFRTQADTVREVDASYDPGAFLINLAEGTDRDAFILEIEGRYGQAVNLEPAEKWIEAQLTQITGGLRTVLLFVSLGLLSVAFITLFNSTAMGIQESRRQLGLYKVLGYTRNQVRQIVVSRAAVLAVVSALLGTLLAGALGASVMNWLMQNMGMVDFPMQSNSAWVVASMAGLIVVCIISAWIPSDRVSAIKPRTLIIE